MWQRYHHDAKGIDVERMAFIGLGVTGKPTARNLLAAGSELTVRSCSPGRGGRVAPGRGGRRVALSRGRSPGRKVRDDVLR
jgi:hypothetical protein